MLLNSNSNQKKLVKNIRVCNKGEDKYFLAEYINRFLVFDLRKNRNTLKVDYDSYLKSVEINKDTFYTRCQYPAFYVLNLFTSRKRAFDLTYGRFILNYDHDKTKNILRGNFKINLNEDREIIIDTKTGENYEIITEKFEVVRRYIPEEFILSSIYEYCWEDNQKYLFKENNLNIYRDDAVILCDSNSIEEAKKIEKILRKNNYRIKIKFYEKLESDAVETIKCIIYPTLLEKKDEHESINQIVHYYLKTNDKYKIAKYIINNKEIIRMFNERTIESFIKNIDKLYNDFYDWDNVIKYPTGSYLLIEFMEKYFSYLEREETENVSENNTEKEEIAGGSYGK